jgi:hypothetical protein
MPGDGLVHQRIIASFVERGRPPSLEELADELGAPVGVVGDALRRLEAEHGVVLHPGSTEVWIAHPFSGSPTGVWVSDGGRGWWAPCLWCALGIAVLAAPGAAIHARYGGEAEPAVFSVEAAASVSPAAFVHFPIAVRKAWDNVVHWCATVQPFRTPDDAATWSARHGFPLGDVVPLDRVLALARVWYGRHLDPGWRKWTVDEARAMFASVGLTSPTWEVPSTAGRF